MLLKKWLSYITDPEYDARERMFIMITLIAMTACSLIFIAGFFIGESATDLIALGVAFVIFSFVTALSQRFHRIDIGASILAFLITFLLLPITFFTGGGIDGGSPMWFIFCPLYVSMILRGRARVFFIASNFIVAGVCYYLAYLRPEWVSVHSPAAAYQDSFISLILVASLVSLMVTYQVRMYMEESRRSEARRAEIEELNMAQNRFFSNMSHEIRTPINTIIGLNEMILREDISDEVAEDAQNVSSAGKMLLSLINDILDMSKLESGEMELSPSAYNTADLLSEVVTMISIRAKEKGLAFTVDIDPKLPSSLYGDEMRIKQILINILTNAIKYTSEGSVTFAVQCEADPDSRAKTRVVFEISDTGMGIRKESIPYLFTAFKRVDEHKNRYIEGTGLGLSITKQFVDLMGGTITVNSVYMRGSKFVVELPQEVMDERPLGVLDFGKRHSEADRLSYRQSFEAPRAKILVVDDTPMNLIVVKKLLRATKVTVDTAESGEEALAKTVKENYHLIFMDHMMPEMDGIECLRRLRTQTGGLCRKAKVIALTANAGSDVQSFYEKEGFDGYLVKPVTGEALERETYRQLPKELVHEKISQEQIADKSVQWMSGQHRRRSIAITTESIADLPRELVERYRIGVLPYRVITDNGIFRDAIDISVSGILRYMSDPSHNFQTAAPTAENHEIFFATILEGANNIIHFTASDHLNNTSYHAASEAAAAFDNVTVFNTGHVSSGEAFFVLEACRMAEESYSVAEILHRMEEMRRLVHTSIVIDSLDYLAKGKQIDAWIAGITKAFPVHPVIALKNGVLRRGRLYLGAKNAVWKKYIADEFRGNKEKIDTKLLYLPYIGLSQAEVESIREEILSYIAFEDIICLQASPTLAANCGPGTFGLTYKEL